MAPLGGFALGSFSMGSSSQGTAGSPIIVIRIQDTNRSALYLLDSLSLEGNLNQRSSARFRLVDRTQTFHPQTGESVRIFQGLDVVFAGTVEEVEEDALSPYGGANVLDVVAVDFNQLADRFLVADAYENTLAGDIVKDIVNSVTGLLKEGVSTAGVMDGVVIQKISFNYVKASRALSDLAEMIGFVWFIDENRVLHFFERDLFQAPTNFGSTGGAFSKKYLSARYRRSRSGYRNRQFLRAGKAETDSFHGQKAALFIGDGKRQSFSLDFEAARGPTISGTKYDKPRIYEDINSTGTFVEVAAAKIGIRGVDDEDKTTPPDKPNAVKADYDFWYFWARGEKEISQNRNFLNTSPAAVLDSNDLLKVEYTGQFPILERQDNAEEQAARVAVEGGTGRYEEIEDDESIDGAEFAEERCSALLGRGDQDLEEFEIETILTGFRVGQKMTLDFPEHAVDGEWVIQGLSMTLLADQAWKSTLQLMLGERRPSEADFWKRMAGAGRKFVERENEKLLILQKSEETAAFEELFTKTHSNVLDAEANDVFILLQGTGLMGGTGMGG